MYSDITKQNIDILVPYIDDRNSKNYQKYKTLSSGVVISAKDVYSISDGNVIFIGQDENKLYTVIIQYNVSICFSYCLLKDISVSLGDIIKRDQQIGFCYKQMRFEYLNLSSDNSLWTVRIGQYTFYKHNPESYIGRTDGLDRDIVLMSGYNTQTIFRSTPNG